jgi:hypothetical protein
MCCVLSPEPQKSTYRLKKEKEKERPQSRFPLNSSGRLKAEHDQSLPRMQCNFLQEPGEGPLLTWSSTFLLGLRSSKDMAGRCAGQVDLPSGDMAMNEALLLVLASMAVFGALLGRRKTRPKLR